MGFLTIAMLIGVAERRSKREAACERLSRVQRTQGMFHE